MSMSRLVLIAALALAGCEKTPPRKVVVTGDAGVITKPPLFGDAPVIETPAPPPEVLAGQQLYVKYCALCHGPEGRGYAADNAPSLVSDTFITTASDAFLAAGIAFGRPGTPMAGYAKARGGPLEDADIAKIITFLRHDRPAYAELPHRHVHDGDAQRAQPIWDSSCKACHGDPTKRGIAPHLSNPELLAAASDEFIRHAIVHGRPGTTMLPKAGLQLDDPQLDDLVALIRSWAKAVVPGPDQPPVVPLPSDHPVVINPKGKPPTFTLREDRFVPAAEVNAALVAKQRMVIIDARASSDWTMSRIPGAISIPYYQPELLDKLPADLEDTWFLAYCACPHHASGVVVDELRKRGYKKTAVIDEGILHWQTQGFKVEGVGTKAGKVKPP